MNKSSSFYSEAYYQKARKQALIRKPIYRQKNKQLFDQEHELQLTHFYINTTGTCQMTFYHDFIIQAFNQLKDKDAKGEIKGSDDFNSAYSSFQTKVRQKFKLFSENIMCNEFETREEVMKRQQANIIFMQAEGTQKVKEQSEMNQSINMAHHKTSQKNQMGIQPRRLATCNQCPIFIEQFQVNFEKITNEINKTSVHWAKLNGRQKFSKLRTQLDQYFGVLKYELATKCTYATEQATKMTNQKRLYNHIKR